MEKLGRFVKHHYSYVILILLWLIAIMSSPFFRTASTFSAIFSAALPIVIIGLSQTIVVISGGFDLSVGAVASLATVISSHLMKYNLFLAICVVVLSSLLIGLINGIGITFFHMEPFIMTMSFQFIINGISLMLRPTPGGYISPGLRAFFMLSTHDIAFVPPLFIVLFSVLGYLFLKRTSLGREIYAIGGNPKGAWMSGIAVNKKKIMVYIISALCASLAGLYLCCRISSGNAEAGSRYLFDSFIVVFMGGTLVSGGVGSFSGTVASSLIIASLVYMLQFVGVSSWYQFIIKGMLLVLVTGLQVIGNGKRRGGNE